MTLGLTVRPITSREAAALVVREHYLHRAPPISFAFGLFTADLLVGVVTYGVPASHHLMKSACPGTPANVLELNRLWVCDSMPRNTESWFLPRSLKMLPPRIIVSYADTSKGHVGYVYRASNFFYAGWTDMERKTPRYDYVVPGKHSRDAFRVGEYTRVRRKPKVKYWTISGNDRRAKRALARAAGWPRLSWADLPPPLPEETPR